VVQARDGNFYGTTEGGGANLAGTVFKITPAGKLTTLYSFCAQTNCTDGTYPYAGLAQGTDGNFYGTTLGGGGNNSCSGGCGTVFKITPAGTLTTLHIFTDSPDGALPYAGMVRGTDGNFYGTTLNGGGYGFGTVFKISAEGNLTTLYSFGGHDGTYPYAGLIQAADGKFYGTTSSGGENINCDCGTVYRITSAGKLTTMHSFDKTDGYLPEARLVQATDGNFYGTTAYGGANNPGGTLFEITSEGKLTTLHSFNVADGTFVNAGMAQATTGIFYGTTSQGGSSSKCFDGCGTFYSLSGGLGPFVETNPTSGKVGEAVIVLGNNLNGTTSVAFNGTAASFTVVSNTEVKTTVPVGATTGFVKVTTPKRTLKSNVVFRVTK
jgi:uncharacterized repeat protein (TIGR03803 family)